MFIEVTHQEKGVKFSMNVNHIVAVRGGDDGSVLSHSNGGADYIQEPYETVKQLISREVQAEGVIDMQIGFKRLNNDAMLPTKAHASDSGFDLYASEDVIIEPSETKLIKTGIAVHLPEGCEAQVRPRSGVTSKTKLRVQLGTIDNEYTGCIGVIIDNAYDETDEMNDSYELIDGSMHFGVRKLMDGAYLIKKGDKLAQLVVQEIPQTETYEVHEIKDTERGANGFGSTGY